MADLVNRMFCEVHQCSISITGCMLRQQRNQDNPPKWMYKEIPGDPGCRDCAQGKGIIEKYKDQKEALMAAHTTLLDSGPARNPHDDVYTGKFVAGKTCKHCDLKVDPTEAEKYFYRSKTTKDGFEGTCKKCKVERATARRRAKRTDEKLANQAAAKSKKVRKAAAPGPVKKDPINTNDPDLDGELTLVKKDTIKTTDPDLAGELTLSKKDTINTKDHNLDQALEQEMWRILEKVRRRVNESNGKKSDPPPDPDDLVRVLLERCGRGDLYPALEKLAKQKMRPVYMQAVYIISGDLNMFKSFGALAENVRSRQGIEDEQFRVQE